MVLLLLPLSSAMDDGEFDHNGGGGGGGGPVAALLENVKKHERKEGAKQECLVGR